MSYLELHAVNKKFGQQIILDEVSLKVEKGELITLLGSSGCGKTTLLRSIAGLLALDSGMIEIDGEDITRLPPRARNLGMVFQSYALFPSMTVYDNIAFGLKMKKMPASQIPRAVKEISDLVGLSAQEKHYPQQLSGGQQQRVALARSLVVSPKLLLLDEPLSALDARLRSTLQVELRRIQKSLGITMILVTHDQEEALTLSDRVFVMEQGKIVQSGSPEEIYTAPATAFVAGFIGNYNLLDRKQIQKLLNKEPGNHDYYAIRPEVIKMLPPDQYLTSNMGSCCPLPAQITGITIKGNYLRYEVQAREVSLYIDQLNTEEHMWAKRSMQVKLWIEESDCIPLIS